METADRSADPPKAEVPKRKLFRFQFSLRSLLIFMLVCAIACAWVTRRMERKRKEREVVEAIIKSGGDAEYDYRMRNAVPPGPDWLRKLLGKNFFSEVAFVNLDRMVVTDAPKVDIVILTALPQLQGLNLCGPFSDSELAHLKALTRLQSLNLVRTKITDAGPENLKGLAQLQSLSLELETNVTDAGMMNLEGLCELQRLDLVDTSVTDVGLRNLKGLAHLKTLVLVTTKITHAGKEEIESVAEL
jgi:Leucine-rich repeat (LRR) protein